VEHFKLLHSLLEQAVKNSANGSVSELQTVLKIGGAGLRGKNEALVTATALAKPEAIELLLEASADPRQAGMWGNTPLHNLCLRGRDIKSVELLLQCRACIDNPNFPGRMPLHFLALGTGEQCTRIGALLLQAKADINAKIAPTKKIESAAGFCQNSAYKYNLDPGQTCLHIVATQPFMRAYPFMVFCLESRADPNILDDVGLSPLHLAVDSGGPKLVQALLDARARPDVQCHRGKSPLDVCNMAIEWALKKRNDEMKRRLVKIHQVLMQFHSMKESELVQSLQEEVQRLTELLNSAATKDAQHNAGHEAGAACEDHQASQGARPPVL